MILFIPGVPRNANAPGEQKYNRWDKAKFRKRARDLAAPLAENRTPWPYTRVTAVHVSPVKRRRDPLGLAERLKGVMDGLVDAGLLIDDDEDHIEVVLAHSRKGAPAGIQLTLTPLTLGGNTPHERAR